MVPVFLTLFSLTYVKCYPSLNNSVLAIFDKKHLFSDACVSFSNQKAYFKRKKSEKYSLIV